MIVDIVFGFLGSGKTTFITRILRQWGSSEKTVVLVNEFGEVGIDGDLLAAQGGNVVEMPSGCICCTLQADFRMQLLEIIHTIEPQRIIIEPTGVATISQIRFIVEAQLFEKYIQRVNNIMIADVTGFMELYKANRHFVESQVEHAAIVLLNKCDRADKKWAAVTRSAIAAINPEISVMMTEFGAVDWAEYHLALSAAPGLREELRRNDHDHDVHGADHDTAGAENESLHHLHPEQNGLGYESYGLIFDVERFDGAALESFFLDLKAHDHVMGEIVRAKGVFRVGGGGILMELASGEFSSQPIGRLKQSKVSIIGKALNRKMIDAALNQCFEESIV